MFKVKVQLFKGSYRSFTEHLSNEGIEFSRRTQLSEIPVAAGMTIEVFSAVAQASPWGALATNGSRALHSLGIFQATQQVS